MFQHLKGRLFNGLPFMFTYRFIPLKPPASPALKFSGLILIPLIKTNTMKKISSTLILLTTLFIYSFGQCNEFYELETGTEWEMENYSAKEKLTGRNSWKVTNYTKTASGYTANVHSSLANEKGKEQAKSDLEMKCENGVFYIDMRNFISEDQLKALGNYETKVEATNLEVPSKLSAGQTLKDGTITITAVGSGIPINMTVNITDRKVVGQESITTPAGTFNAYKISSKMTLQNQMGINMTFNFSAIEWIAPKVGLVRSESYNKNEKLVGYSVLSKRK